MYRFLAVAIFFASISSASAHIEPGQFTTSIAHQRDSQCPKSVQPDVCIAEYNEVRDLALQFDEATDRAKEAEGRGDMKNMNEEIDKSIDLLRRAIYKLMFLWSKYGQPN